MTSRVFPTMRQIVHYTLAAINCHPRIKNPGIYYPVQTGLEPQEVFIESYRAYDGIELQSTGLSCDVFPYYSQRTFSSGPRGRSGGNSAKFMPINIGAKSSSGNFYEGVYQLIVQLQYPAVAINEQVEVSMNQVVSAHGIELTSPHGYNVSLIEKQDEQPYDNSLVIPGVREENEPGLYIQNNKFTVEINPAEDLLRDYVDLMRLVLDDIPLMLPFSVRSTQVKEYDFPTTSWNRTSSDIYFHYAWLLWEISLYAPSNWRDLYFMPVSQINTDVNKKE